MYTPNKYEVFIEKMSAKTNKYLVTLNTVDFPEAGFRINKSIKKKLGLKDKINYQKSTPKMNGGGQAQMVQKGYSKAGAY